MGSGGERRPEGCDPSGPTAARGPPCLLPGVGVEAVWGEEGHLGESAIEPGSNGTHSTMNEQGHNCSCNTSSDVVSFMEEVKVKHGGS